MKKVNLLFILIVVATVGCESEEIQTTANNDSLYFDSVNRASERYTDSLIAEIDVIFDFRQVSDELKLNEQLYNATGEEKYRIKHNSLLPEYHRIGKQFDSLQRKNKEVNNLIHLK